MASAGLADRISSFQTAPIIELKISRQTAFSIIINFLLYNY